MILTWGTCLAVDLIRAIVLTVVKEVTAQSRADASAIGTQELILLTCGNRWRGHCRHMTHTQVSNLLNQGWGRRGFHSYFNDSTTYRSSVHPSCRRSYWHHHTSLTLAGIRGRFGSGELWWEDTGTSLRAEHRKTTRGTKRVEEKNTSGQRIKTYRHSTCVCDSQGCTLTALFRILVRVVPTVVLPVTLPGEGFTQSVVTLELIQRAVTSSWKKRQEETGRGFYYWCGLYKTWCTFSWNFRWNVGVLAQVAKCVDDDHS